MALRRSALVLCTIVSLVIVSASGWLWWRYRTFNSQIVRLNIHAGGAPQPKNDIDGKDQNILIVGNDNRNTATDAELKELGTGRDGGSLNTDTMMIVHVPANGKAATLISLPRDSWVSIPGYGMGKLNSAYPDAYNAASGSETDKEQAAAALLVTTVQNLTGLTVDHFVQVDLIGFYRISNVIGPITVNMCEAVQESKSGINLHKGINQIVGTQALAFVRQRYGFPNGLGDLDRVQRQRYFLTAAFRKLASAGTLLNPTKLTGLLNAVKNSVSVDQNLDLFKLAQQMEDLSANNIKGQTIPTDGFGNEGGQSVVVVNPSEVKEFVSKMIGNTTPAATASKVAPSSVTVDVFNAGSGIDNAAHQAAEAFQAAGFQVGEVSNAESTSSTTVEYPAGMASQAATVAAYLPGAQLQQTSSVSRVTVLLGGDGITVQTPGSSSSTTGASSGAAGSSSSTGSTNQPLDAGCIN